MNLNLFEDIFEHPDYPGYYVHPQYDRVVVSPTGKFIDIVANACLIPYVGFWPYPIVSTGSNRYLVHRTLCEMFIPCPGDRKDYMVNHIDGDKENYKLYNLEWVTASENLLHAYKTGLRTDNKPIEVRNLLTDEIVVEYSLNEIARQFGINPAKISIYLSSLRDAPFMEHYAIRFVDEPQSVLTIADAGKHRNGLCKDVILTTDDNQIIIFESVGKAAKYLGTKPHMFYSYLNNGTVKRLDGTGAKKIAYLKDYKSDIANAKRIKMETRRGDTPVRKPIPIRVTNLYTAEVKVWESCEQFAAVYGVLRNTLQKNIYERGRWREFQIEYIK